MHTYTHTHICTCIHIYVYVHIYTGFDEVSESERPKLDGWIGSSSMCTLLADFFHYLASTVLKLPFCVQHVVHKIQVASSSHCFEMPRYIRIQLCSYFSSLEILGSFILWFKKRKEPERYECDTRENKTRVWVASEPLPWVYSLDSVHDFFCELISQVRCDFPTKNLPGRYLAHFLESVGEHVIFKRWQQNGRGISAGEATTCSTLILNSCACSQTLCAPLPAHSFTTSTPNSSTVENQGIFLAFLRAFSCFLG